jgi:hypothetical protein
MLSGRKIIVRGIRGRGKSAAKNVILQLKIGSIKYGISRDNNAP